jgi:hypothetical protein
VRRALTDADREARGVVEASRQLAAAASLVASHLPEGVVSDELSLTLPAELVDRHADQRP